MSVDLFAPSFTTDRYRLYAELLDTAPVASVKLGPAAGWLVSRYDDVLSLLRDSQMLVRRPGTGLDDRLGEGPAARLSRIKMSLVDPPDHVRLRKLVAKGFTPRVVGELRPRIEAITTSLLDDLAGRNEIDLVKDFAARLPASVICDIIGVQESDWDLLISKVDDFLPLLTPFPLDAQTLDRANAVCQFYFDYFGARIDELAAGTPRDDLLGALLAAEEEGSRLTRDELIVTMESILNAGYETTTSSIAEGVLALVTHPDQLDWLQQDVSGRVAAAVEEILRWEAPVQFTFRFAGEHRQLHATDIEPGDAVLLSLGAANHDPRRFPAPERFELARGQDGRQLAFGAGRHVCLGEYLARLEAQVALGELIRRFPRLTLVETDITRRPNPMFPALEHLPVVLDPARRS